MAMMSPPHAPNLPDLLHAQPWRRIDTEATDLAIVMAFAGGSSPGLFPDTLDQANTAPSTWEPRMYARDLFVRQFVESCFRIGPERRTPLALRHLARVLGSPPSDLTTVEYRRRIVAELLDNAELRSALERLYATVLRFRALLEGGGPNIDPNRRQLEVLASFKAIVEMLDEEFANARSGLGRLHAFGHSVRATEGFRSLLDLLKYDEQLARVTFKVNIGADGRVRRLDLIAVEESDRNVFVSSPWRRFLAKLELLARGYRFGNGEVVARLLDAVFEGVRENVVPLVQLLGDLEFYLGALGFYDQAREAGLRMSLPELVTTKSPRRLCELFNPLLLGHGITPIPCTIETDRHDTIVLVTGPNSGGKTRLLQSLGLAQLMAQSGLFIPASSGQVALTPRLVVSLIQETQVDQTEGRLGVELMRIRSLFEHLPPGAMVILDELCSGTNPSEGEEIFELVVRMLTQLSPQAFITTHFLTFASRLATESKIEELRFLQVLLDDHQGATYQFGPGVATTSLAAQAAARLGVTGDQLSALIEQNVRRSQALDVPPDRLATSAGLAR